MRLDGGLTHRLHPPPTCVFACLLQDMPSAAELAGAKVKHTADELDEGETMILTLGERLKGRGSFLRAVAGWQNRGLASARRLVAPILHARRFELGARSVLQYG